MDARRRGEIIRIVNSGQEFKSDSKAEMEYYKSLVAEADKHEKEYGIRPVFELPEMDSDDPELDIYSENDLTKWRKG